MCFRTCVLHVPGCLILVVVLAGLLQALLGGVSGFDVGDSPLDQFCARAARRTISLKHRDIQR